MSDRLPYDITPHDSSALVLSHHPPRLEHLDCFKIDSTELGAVRSLLECFTLPHETFLTLYTDSAYDALSECLPVTHRLQSIPFIDQVELNVCRPEHQYPHVVEGFAPEEKDGLSRTRLAVHSSDTSILHRDFDLLRLFKGFAPIFLPGVVVDLVVTLSQPVRRGQSEAWAWLLRYFPRITNLSVEAASNIEFFTVLAEDVMSELSSLSVTLVGADDWVIEREVTVSVLEIRAFRGLHLRSFVYREQVKRGLGELPPSLPTSYVERLQAVCPGGKVLEPYCVD
ncbi:hypothetical protein L226DRAFT_533164 [Lentinus tigrinus ALCF2SS1-7]|uniref:uncharacterized protein n=1 Tax=Lentinus tigrinus ALCF2SS1-7 TaxID=1328758 RepID=UPI001165EFCD|nr:hypothetical protein L226DRAFT_533164 [Lentinus tigrinus ALCF2SS1-7]